MPNLFQQGAAWLGTRLQASAGRSVTIRRQQKVSAAITGWVASHEYDEVGENGVVTTIVMDDWTFKATDVVIDGRQTELQDGDVITETLNGVEHVFKVRPVSNKRSCEWLDTSGILLLVHTKRIKSREL